MDRRQFLSASIAAMAPLCAAETVAMKPKERVEAVLAGRAPDRAPISFWHHFGLQAEPPAAHAKATLAFQRKFKLDLVKVMSDFPYPKGAGSQWYELHVTENPFPHQLEALKLIRAGLAGEKYFVETLFNPYNVAEKLSSPAAVKQLREEKPQALLDALDVIAKSQTAHARKALSAGAAGIFLAIANAQDGIMTREEYRKFSEPFDRMILDVARQAPLNTLHLHGDKVYLDLFWKGWSARVINYSAAGTGVSLTEARRKFNGVLMGGVDERAVKTQSAADLAEAIKQAKSVGPKWICAPGCSVPDDSSDADLLKLTKASMQTT
jgi:uroporphyrinogen decarboxylase